MISRFSLSTWVPTAAARARLETYGRDLSRMVVLAAACFCAARLGPLLTGGGGALPLITFLHAVAVVALVQYGSRLVFGVAAGAFGFYLSTGLGWQAATIIGTADALAALIGASLIARRRPFDRHLGQFRDVVVVLAGAGLVATTISAVTHAMTLVAMQRIAPDNAWPIGFAIWTAAAQGVFLAVPLLFTCIARPAADRAVAFAITVGALTAAAIAWGPALLEHDLGANAARQLVSFALFPLAITLALRFAPREIAIFNACAAAATIAAQLIGVHPYLSDTVVGSLALMHGFIAFFVATTLAFSAINFERRNANAALGASEMRFRSLTEMGNDWYWEQGRDLRFTQVSNGVAATGFDQQQLLGRALAELSFDVAPQILAAHQRLVEAHRPFRDFMLKRRLESGETRYFLTSGDPIFLDSGAFLGYRGVGRDITAEKWAEEALRESEQRYASIFHHSSAAIIVLGVDEAGAIRFESCNSAGEGLLATRAHVLIGETLDQSLPESLARGLAERIRASLRVGNRVTEEHDLVLEAATRRVVTTVVPMRRIPGRVERVLLIAIDITEQTRAAERASESEALFSRVFDGSPHAMSFVRVADYTITEVNEAWEHLFGMSRGDAVGRSSVALGLVPDEGSLDPIHARLRTGHSVRDVDLAARNGAGRALDLLFSADTLQIHGEPHIVAGFVDITERKRAEQAVRRSEESFSTIFRASPVPMVIQSYPEHRYVEVNAAWSACFGFSRAEVVGKTPLEIGVWADAIELEQIWGIFERTRRVSNSERRMRKRTGELVDVLNSAELLMLDGAERVIISSIDITERKSAERLLRQSERRFRDFAEAAGEFVWEVDADQRIMFVSNRVEHVLEYPPQSLLGRRFAEVMPTGEVTRVAEWLDAHRDQDGGFRNLEVAATARTGRTVWLAMNAVATSDLDGHSLGLRGTALDITERKHAEQRIKDLATRDPLTGLPNRLLLQDRLQQGIASAARSNDALAVLFIDLDHFKRVNDTLGHHVGDGLLNEVARRLSTVIRKGDTLARLGGDEFLIVLDGLKEPADAGQVAQKIINMLSAPYEVESHRLSTAASVGIALYPTDGTDVATLMRHADTAMYAAKSSGRRTYQYFSSDMNLRVLARVQLESDLHRAITEGELRIFYQPRVTVGDDRVTSVEALLRWRHPRDGLLLPSNFLQVAEETGLLLEMGDWVLDGAIAQAQAWNNQLARPLRVCVNIAARQFSARLVDQVSAALERHSLDPTLLELDVCEGTLMRDLDESRVVVDRLRAIGCRVIVDDFGTGYSSMLYLRRIAVSAVKIDGSFVRRIDTSRDDRIVVKAIVEMARSLDIGVLAEGTETIEQRDILRELGCEEYSGNLYLAPVSAAELERHLMAGSNVLTLAARRAPG